MILSFGQGGFKVHVGERPRGGEQKTGLVWGCTEELHLQWTLVL